MSGTHLANQEQLSECEVLCADRLSVKGQEEVQRAESKMIKRLPRALCPRHSRVSPSQTTQENPKLEQPWGVSGPGYWDVDDLCL